MDGAKGKGAEEGVLHKEAKEGQEAGIENIAGSH